METTVQPDNYGVLRGDLVALCDCGMATQTTIRLCHICWKRKSSKIANLIYCLFEKWPMNGRKSGMIHEQVRQQRIQEESFNKLQANL